MWGSNFSAGGDRGTEIPRADKPSSPSIPSGNSRFIGPVSKMTLRLYKTGPAKPSVLGRQGDHGVLPCSAMDNILGERESLSSVVHLHD